MKSDQNDKRLGQKILTKKTQKFPRLHFFAPGKRLAINPI